MQMKELAGTGMNEGYNNQYLWNNRQTQKVYAAFVDVWGTNKLWVTIDRANLNFPIRKGYEYKGFIHWDYDPETKPQNVQGVIALSDQTDINMGLEKIAIHNANLQKNIEDLEVLSSRLQSGAMNFRMLPISNLFNRFPAQVRDIARQIGKKVELKIQGGETELDKILINQLADPLLHLIRNSIDHGIETDQQRVAISKNEIGQINLSAYYLGSNAIIEIEDDGRGIAVSYTHLTLPTKRIV